MENEKKQTAESVSIPEEINTENLVLNSKTTNAWWQLAILPILAIVLYHVFNFAFTLLIPTNIVLQRYAFGVSSILVLGGFFYLFGLKSNKLSPEEVGLSPIRLGNPLWVLLGVLTILVYLLLRTFSIIIFPQFWTVLFSGEVFTSENMTPKFWAELVVIGFMAPLGEELFFRGFLYRSVQKKAGSKIGILFSALYFGLVHLDPIQGLFAFLISIPLAYFYEKSKSIYLPMILHILNNVVVHFIMLVLIVMGFY